jgi:hypothetical protein
MGGEIIQIKNIKYNKFCSVSLGQTNAVFWLSAESDNT